METDTAFERLNNIFLTLLSTRSKISDFNDYQGNSVVLKGSLINDATPEATPGDFLVTLSSLVRTKNSETIRGISS